MTVLVVATLGGIAVTLQGNFMGTMTRHMGTLESMFITYGSGGLVVTALFLMRALTVGSGLSQWREVPVYAFGAGLLGLVIVGSIGFATARYGLIATFAIILVAQYSSAAVIDHFGLFGAPVQALDPLRTVGIVLLLIGAWLVLR
ncbi:MAG: DMT family transporter [Caldilineaceae bacterium]|nr:DMT family transporter [Caldilineaceae bacterium]